MSFGFLCLLPYLPTGLGPVGHAKLRQIFQSSIATSAGLLNNTQPAASSRSEERGPRCDISRKSASSPHPSPSFRLVAAFSFFLRRASKLLNNMFYFPRLVLKGSITGQMNSHFFPCALREKWKLGLFARIARQLPFAEKTMTCVYYNLGWIVFRESTDH